VGTENVAQGKGLGTLRPVPPKSKKKNQETWVVGEKREKNFDGCGEGRGRKRRNGWRVGVKVKLQGTGGEKQDRGTSGRGCSKPETWKLCPALRRALKETRSVEVRDLTAVK